MRATSGYNCNGSDTAVDHMLAGTAQSGLIQEPENEKFANKAGTNKCVS